MTIPDQLNPDALLDQPPLTAAEVRALESAVAGLLNTSDDIVLCWAEAITLLEAVARNVGVPGSTAINVVTGPYGGLFGNWMRAGGASVVDVTAEPDRVIDPGAVRAAIAAAPQATVLALVHAEAATGGTNPVAEIAAVARAAGLVVVLDAVASIGAEPVLPADWGIDICVIGGQKALAGPAGVSAASVSPAAWALIERNPAALRASTLSLLDWRERWLGTDRTVVPGLPSWLEGRALLAALERVAAEGLDAVLDRHRRAAAAARAGVTALGLPLWQRGPAGFAPVTTTVRIPDGTDPAGFRAAAMGAEGRGPGIVGPGDGVLRDRLMRLNHTGRRATPAAVAAALEALAGAVALAAAAPGTNGGGRPSAGPAADLTTSLTRALSAAEAAWRG